LTGYFGHLCGICEKKGHHMLTQIYEVSTPQEADAISSLGVDHIGVVCTGNLIRVDEITESPKLVE
jgi:hypothetical protein